MNCNFNFSTLVILIGFRYDGFPFDNITANISSIFMSIVYIYRWYRHMDSFSQTAKMPEISELRCKFLSRHQEISLKISLKVLLNFTKVSLEISINILF